MILLSPAAQSAITGNNVSIVQLLLLGFSTPVALNTSNYDFTFEGITYNGAYGAGSINMIEDSPGEIKGVQFQLNGGPAGAIALALDESKTWQGTAVTVRLAILDSSFSIVEAPVVWQGSGDTLSITEDEGGAIISATAESTAIDLLRGSALTYSDADQQMLYPGDKGISLLLKQADQPVVWPTKAWYYK